MRYVYAIAIIGAIAYGGWWLYQEHKRRVAIARYNSVRVPGNLLAEAVGMGAAAGASTAGPPTFGVSVDAIDPSLIGMESNMRSRLMT